MDDKTTLPSPPAPTPRSPTSKKHLFTALSIVTVLATTLYNSATFTTKLTLPLLQPSNKPLSLTTWLERERPIALQGILANIGGASGSAAAGANPGIVIASPSKSDPDYFYTWTRDAALTIKSLVDELNSSSSLPPWTSSSDLETTIQDYISSQATLQGVENLSGSLCEGGLGEAKFNPDGTPFTGAWGRPQSDGPALRAVALVAYARELLSRGAGEEQEGVVRGIVWPVVRNDLSYLMRYWNETTFDLWEEVRGRSFFTSAVQYRALVEGLWMAGRIGVGCEGCEKLAGMVLCALQDYWGGGFVVSNLGVDGRSGVDLNSILTSTHMFDANAGCDERTFQPCSGSALANHKVVTDDFRSLYAVNGGVPAGVGVAVGRYPEDVYMGGNPWYLGAFAAAEMLYQAVFQWRQLGMVNITATSHAFFADLYPSAVIGSHPATSPEFEGIIDAVSSYADSYMANAQKFTPANGALAEQYSRNDGTPVSARDLTWSYAAFLTAHNARKGIMPASWGASSVNLPSVCSADSVQGPCSTATNIAWPSRTSRPPCSTPSLTTVMFTVRRSTVYGQNLFLSGSCSQLGGWNASRALPLSAGKYTQEQPVWYTFESFPVGVDLEYKYVLKNVDGNTVAWENGPNRRYAVPASCEVSVKVNDVWR